MEWSGKGSGTDLNSKCFNAVCYHMHVSAAYGIGCLSSQYMSLLMGVGCSCWPCMLGLTAQLRVQYAYMGPQRLSATSCIEGLEGSRALHSVKSLLPIHHIRNAVIQELLPLPVSKFPPIPAEVVCRYSMLCVVGVCTAWLWCSLAAIYPVLSTVCTVHT